MKNRDELIEYFTDSLEYDDANNIVDELKEDITPPTRNICEQRDWLERCCFLRTLKIMIPQRLI